MALTLWRETSSCSARKAWDQPRRARSSLRWLFIAAYPTAKRLNGLYESHGEPEDAEFHERRRGSDGLVALQEIHERHEGEGEADGPEDGHDQLVAFEFVDLVAQVDAYDDDHGNDIECRNCGK